MEKCTTSSVARRLVQLALAQQEQVQKGEQPSAGSWCDSLVDWETTVWLFLTCTKAPSSIQGRALCMNTIRDIMNAKNFIRYKNSSLSSKIASFQPLKSTYGCKKRQPKSIF
jgi:alpha-D-ribose 1-methylphosphonate 5-triphosphate synthase subunit PhnH